MCSLILHTSIDTVATIVRNGLNEEPRYLQIADNIERCKRDADPLLPFLS